MTKITLDLIKKLRLKTKVGVMDCRQALEEADGDLKKAEEWLRQKGIKGAEKRADRETAEGIITTYSHGEGKIVAVVELFCETDFVACTDDFKNLAHELAMQVAAMAPKDAEELLIQPYIRDTNKVVGDLLKETISKLGENIRVGRLARYQLGEERTT